MNTVFTFIIVSNWGRTKKKKALKTFYIEQLL